VSNDWPHSLHLNNSLEGTKYYRRQDLKNLHFCKHRLFTSIPQHCLA
jgi:hypothetical protein